MTDQRFGSDVAARYDASRGMPPAALAELHDRVTAATGIRPGDRLLEAGAGTGLLSAAFLGVTDGDTDGHGFRYVAVDASASMLSQFLLRYRQTPLNSGGTPLALVQGDLRSLPFTDAGFDAVVALRVFGVVPGWRRAVHECVRILRPGGSLIAGRLSHEGTGTAGLHAFLRRERNALLTEMEEDTRRPGAGEEALAVMLATVAARQDDLPTVRWRVSLTPRQALDGNLTGWRVQALPPAVRDDLRLTLSERLRARYGDLDRPYEEEASLLLHHARMR